MMKEQSEQNMKYMSKKTKLSQERKKKRETILKGSETHIKRELIEADVKK